MRQQPRLRAYLVAILAVLAAVGMRVLWKPLIGTESPFLLFFAALACASWYGGMRPGILATGLGAFFVAFLGLLPVGQSRTPDLLHLAQFGTFIATGSLISLLMGRLHAALDRSERAERELERRVRERTQQLVDTNRLLHELSGELLSAQEKERLRISKELHDDLGQTLTLVKLKMGLVDANLAKDVQAAKKYCEDAATHVDQAIKNMRRISRDLSPVMVETLGITVALRRLADEFNTAGGIRIAADIEPIDDLLPLGSAILLYRIAQEALNNIAKHAGASAAAIGVHKKDGRVYVEVKDNGKGLDPGRRERGPISSGLGLAIMTERVRTLGGALEIQSQEGTGTRLQFTIPAKKDNRTHSDELPPHGQGAGI